MAIEWKDQGIILDTRPHGERGMVVSLLTANHGLSRGWLHRFSATSSKTPSKKPSSSLGAWGCGGQGVFTWKARLHEQLGTITGEPSSQLMARLFSSPAKLSLLHHSAQLLAHLLPQGYPYPGLFDAFMAFATHDLPQYHGLALWPRYVLFEVYLLQELGFGLDFSTCALTGSNEDLAYVSPKTGRAASEKAGSPFRDKLLPLPRFMWDDIAPVCAQDIRDGLRITGHFLYHHAFIPKYTPPPLSPQGESLSIKRGGGPKIIVATRTITSTPDHQGRPLKIWQQLRSPITLSLEKLSQKS